MSLLDSAKSQINSVINKIKTVANATVNSTTITYGFIGVSTVIISYYTFFENDIEIPQEAISSSELAQPSMEQPQSLPEPQPQFSPETQTQQGGRRKKTRRNKKE
jgi:hypothetical protein